MPVSRTNAGVKNLTAERALFTHKVAATRRVGHPSAGAFKSTRGPAPRTSVAIPVSRLSVGDGGAAGGAQVLGEHPALVLCRIVACEGVELVVHLRTEAQMAYALAAYHAEV